MNKYFILLFCLFLNQSNACAPIPADWKKPINTLSEEAVIYWDEANQMEYFIRSARFKPQGKLEHFGFLVPSPSVPEISEKSDTVFYTLNNLKQPETKTVEKFKGFKFESYFFCS